MINPDELAICRRRGHQYRFLLREGWAQCEACGAWIREIRTIEESEHEPQGAFRLNPRVLDHEQLAVCRRRGHERPFRGEWSQCRWCGLWLRERRQIEEREDEPPENELSPDVQAQRALADIERQIRERSSGKDRPN